jgi:hypothetical protein
MSLVVPPYPPPRYTKDEPEVSAWLKRSDEPPDYETYGVKYRTISSTSRPAASTVSAMRPTNPLRS